jgi:hypothetical protein
MSEILEQGAGPSGGAFAAQPILDPSKVKVLPANYRTNPAI